MTSRERVRAALAFQPVDKIPLEIEPGFDEFESDIHAPFYKYGPGKAFGAYGVKGIRADDWGSIWESAEDGVSGEVRQAMFESYSELNNLYIPYDVLEEADMSQVNNGCATSDKFTMKMWGTMPFQRMQYLRGTEALFMDIALEDENLLRLMDKVHGFYKAEVQMWVETDVDAIHLEDDWGTQQSLLISPATWRQLFKPLYKEYCEIAKAHGKLVVMHSDGYIMDIIPDLIEIGVTAINPQLNAMPYKELSELIKGKMALWGGIDRQWLLTFGTKSDVEADVKQVAKMFCTEGKSGVVGQCFKDKGAKDENIRQVYNSWLGIAEQ